MRVTDLIAAKRDGRRLSSGDLYDFATAIAQDRLPDYQISAWLMAAYLRGLSRDETLGLTMAMRDSGRIAEWSEGPPLADKHSTGGVGDKISLILAPLAAACGLRIPMISGRSLGHTGGTLDKLESIPGMNVGLPLDVFIHLVNENGVAMSGQTDDLAPADRKLYALRDATSTVTSIPLICASILSKKLAENTDLLVFDVKTGSGAFMSEESRARKLASELVSISRGAGVEARALITSMESPLGMMVGNRLEVVESIQVLNGEGPQDVRELSLALTSEMLRTAFPEEFGNGESALIECAEKLDGGAAFEKFVTMVESQGGDLGAFESLPSADFRLELKAGRSGSFSGMDAYEVGQAVRALGGGRYEIDDLIRSEVGWQQVAAAGTEVSSGSVIGIVHAASREDGSAALERLAGAVCWDRPAAPLIREVL
jgi:pyrimidine-nucleoside phosphorylase